MDLLRKVLFYIEENYQAGQGPVLVEIDGYDSGTIYEHCILAEQAGLIQNTVDCSDLSGRQCLVENLTNEGYDYLDKIRNDTVWNKTKEVIAQKGLPLVIGTIKTISNAVISAMAEGVAKAIIENGGL